MQHREFRELIINFSSMIFFGIILVYEILI